MSLVLSPATDESRQQQQLDDSPPFGLQLRDGSPPSPERKTDSHLKETPVGAHVVGNESPYRRMQLKVQKLKEALQVMRVEKDEEIAFLKAQLVAQQQSLCLASESKESSTAARDNNAPHLVPWMHSITERGDIQTSRLGRHASLKSVKALADLQHQQQQKPHATGSSPLAERMAAAFLNPVLSLPYLHSIQFGADLVELSAQVSTLLESEARCLSLASPVYVFGDLHGNLADLNFFSSHLWRFGLGLTAGSFLFLGDYVDRGMSSLECVAYLFAQKLLHPRKVFLLRGNHETRAVNGLEAYYGSGCFLTQCRQRFGRDEGYIVWHQINHAFDRLPLAATIDDAIFCVHGGIPRALPGGGDSRLDAIRALPATAPMDVLDMGYHDTNPQFRMVSDLLWGDPAKEEHEAALDPISGFGKSVLRGGSAVSFGAKAVDDFVAAHGFSHVLRAHEACADGVGVSKSARVLTIFSTSKDHALGDDATCGCVLVDRDRVAAINRAAGQAQSLRRRRSVTSLQPPPLGPVTATDGSSFSATSLSAYSSGGGHDESPVAAAAAAVASPSAPLTGSARSRRRSSHCDAYPGSLGAPPRLRSSEVRAASSVGRCDQDESDSTDDEAPVTSSDTSASPLGAASGTIPLRRPAQGDGDNNQSEDSISSNR